MTNGNAIIDVGDWAKPANTLIEKISEAVGGICKPGQIRRVALAKADAAKIKAQAEIEVNELSQRALNRFISEQTSQQLNIESITRKALPYLNDDSKPETLEKDWIVNFFDKSRLISDEEMQDLWARILAGEATQPGSISKRTINSLNSLDKQDAELFASLCSFSTSAGVLIFDINHQIYNSSGINFGVLKHLEEIGLITFNNVVAYSVLQLPQKIELAYFNEAVSIQFANESNNTFSVGKVLLSQVGVQLATVCRPKKIEDFWLYLIDHLIAKGLRPISEWPNKTEHLSRPIE